MGLLTEGHTLTWNEIKDLREQFRNYALEQLIRIYQKYQDRQGDAFTWGDEVKYFSTTFFIYCVFFVCPQGRINISTI